MVAPVSTYRVQLHAGFSFDDAAAVVPYLRDLGVTHLYCSPYLQAAPGSTHGYDVVDHGRLNAELGGPEAHQRLVAACREAGLGVVLDIVPNHMAVSEPESQNAAWWDVLKSGRASTFADWFDVDWESASPPLVPVLGDQLGVVVAAGEITYDDSGDEPVVRYYDHVLPVAPGTEKLADDLLALLDAQHYRLCHWRLAGEELNYPRFFDVTTLAGVRVEDPAVLEATHRLVLDQVARGEVDALRIDHPDGLADPEGYLRRLADATGGLWVAVEKILEPGEELPATWPCVGTTGYDALNRVTGLLVDPAGEAALTTLYGEVTSEPADFEHVVAASKSLVLRDVLGAEVNRLTSLVTGICALDPRHRDRTTRALREALVAVLAAFDVYRAYVPADGGPVPETARERLAHVAERARAAAPRRSEEIDLVVALAAGDGLAAAEGRERSLRAELVTRFQQTCGPVMAKGVEDTAFYRYHRLVALNEVGGAPDRFGTSVAEFHTASAAMARDWPHSMTTLSTHDTKRSEDVRARLAVLSEAPREWAEAVARWTAGNARFKTCGVPDRNAEYLLYQTLVGAWPLSTERAVAYMEKASREAKQHTSWVDPDPAYDEALADFVRSVLADETFVADVEVFVASIRAAGDSNAVAQKLVQLTMPGVADVYQGTELEALSLVDPDNRRPVDYAERRRLLDSPDAPRKLRVTAAALRLRRDHPDWFLDGSYEGVDAGEHAIAFLRAGRVLTVATRRPYGLAARGGHGDAALEVPAGAWVDVLSGRRHDGGSMRLHELLDDAPVALLVRDA